MALMRVLAKSIACEGFGGTGAAPETLIALPTEGSCFIEWHRPYVPCALLGLMCLYPSAVLTRPLFQALDTKLNLRFDYNYLFVFGQIQTALLLCSAFFPGKPEFLLIVCLIADVTLMYYFKEYEPCTSTAMNKCATRYVSLPYACIGLSKAV